jgi:hypothetical protein
MAAVTSAVAAVMVKAEAMAMAMAVTLVAARGGGKGSNGTTTDVCSAILPRYADVIDDRSDDDGNRAPTINGGNIAGGVTDFDNGMPCMCGGQKQWQGEGGNTGGGGGGGGRKRKHRKAIGGGDN